MLQEEPPKVFRVNNAKGGLPPFQFGEKISVFELANLESRTRQRSRAVQSIPQVPNPGAYPSPSRFPRASCARRLASRLVST